MLKALSLATVVASALAFPAVAQDAKQKIDPATSGPTSTMSDQTPQMKDDGAADDAAPGGNNSLPAAESMRDATPSMKPNEAAAGQAAPSGAISLTSQEADLWIDKPVYSSDGKQIGEVASFQRNADNTVTEMQADLGGFLGLGESRVSLAPGQFKLQSDRIVLEMTAAEAQALTPIVK